MLIDIIKYPYKVLVCLICNVRSSPLGDVGAHCDLNRLKLYRDI